MKRNKRNKEEIEELKEFMIATMSNKKQTIKAIHKTLVSNNLMKDNKSGYIMTRRYIKDLINEGRIDTKALCTNRDWEKDMLPIVKMILTQYPMRVTIRQVYYRLVGRYLTVSSSTYSYFDQKMTEWRNNDIIDWRKIEDRSRRVLGGDHGFSSMKSYIKSHLESLKQIQYKRRLWDKQPKYIEIWIEKDALSGVVTQVTNKYGVKTVPTRGISSQTLIREAVERFKRLGDREAKILFFSDHDCTGLFMEDDLESRFSRYGAWNIEIERICLTKEQVKEYNLSKSFNEANPKDNHYKHYVQLYGKETWELDAIEPLQFQEIVEEAIKLEIDWDIWNNVREEESKEQSILEEAFANYVTEKIEEIEEYITEAISKYD